ncbi:cAMP-dependent protein kinase inhibitor gamma isoform X1 [Pogona vitticeps]|nr:cAMP-dependent protein kinase inhibitor gamma isoform X1 [Pogona vitticeps]XP_020644941.1 cAMP-dependent protein kinase inhibitor gamma isoform X1 [Pogona vitticeps]XP_020644942.1 cAMP-dependent protein kinase inhibitor gamma isoform X1 [Pogona vitticeps]
MSENRKGTFLQQCKKCQIDMNGDMLDSHGVCPRCRAEAGDEHKGKRDSATKNADDIMESEAAYSDFISCDRSGRRNAIHDLQGDAAALNLEKLASTMDDIAITEEEQLLSAENQVEDGATEKESGIMPKSQNSSPTL